MVLFTLINLMYNGVDTNLNNLTNLISHPFTHPNTGAKRPNNPNALHKSPSPANPPHPKKTSTPATSNPTPRTNTPTNPPPSPPPTTPTTILPIQRLCSPSRVLHVGGQTR